MKEIIQETKETTRDDRDDGGDDRDDGETQEMKKTMMEEGRIAASMRDGEGREESRFDAYLYLIQAIYMETRLAQPLESQRWHTDPAT